MDPSLKARMHLVCHVRRVVELDAGGSEVLGPVRRYMVHIEPVTRYDGLARFTETLIIVDADDVTSEEDETIRALTEEDRFWFYGADPTKPELSKTPKRVELLPTADGRAFDHFEVFV